MRQKLHQALSRLHINNFDYALQEAAVTVAMFHSHPKFIIDFVKKKGYLSTQLVYLESIVESMRRHVYAESSRDTTTTKNIGNPARAIFTDVESSPQNSFNNPSPVTEERNALRREAALKRRIEKARRTSEDSMSSFDSTYLSSPKEIADDVPIFNIVKKREEAESNKEKGGLKRAEKGGKNPIMKIMGEMRLPKMLSPIADRDHDESVPVSKKEKKYTKVDERKEKKEESLREDEEKERLRRVELAKLEGATKKNAARAIEAEESSPSSSVTTSTKKNSNRIIVRQPNTDNPPGALFADVESSPHNSFNSPSPVTEERDAMRREAAPKRRIEKARRDESAPETKKLKITRNVNVVGNKVDNRREKKEESLRGAEEKERLRRNRTPAFTREVEERSAKAAKGASRRDKKEEERLGEALTKALMDDEDGSDIGQEEDLSHDAGADASMPSLFDGLDESEVFVNQQQGPKAFFCASTTAAATPPSHTGNSSGSGVITIRPSRNEGGRESLLGRKYTSAEAIPCKKQQGFS